MFARTAYRLTAALAVAAAVGAVSQVPSHDGMHVLWSDDFSGREGSGVNGELWDTIDRNLNINGEFQTYSKSRANVQLSGGDTLQLVPRNNQGRWTSGRIESKNLISPKPGKMTRVEASLRMGGNSAGSKQGIWPAFWALGSAIREGTPWPLCGEIDIVEQKNGIATNFATAHCGTMPGGPCQEPVGRSKQTAMSQGSNFDTWALTWDLRSSDWRKQVTTWHKNGAAFHTLTGADMNDEPMWSTLAHRPMFVVLNVAVGGNFPGGPNGATKDGFGAMLEVSYVAAYSS